MGTLETFFWQIFPILLTIAIPIVVVFFIWLAKRVAEWLNLGNQLNIDALIMGMVEQGISYAEQLGEKKKKEGEELHGEDKLYLAVEYVITELNKYGVFTITAQEIANKVEAYLGQMAVVRNKTLGPMEGLDDSDGL